MTMDGTPRKAPLSAKKNKSQVLGVFLSRSLAFVASRWPEPLGVVYVMQMDRFIPARSAMDLDVANFNLLKENNGQANSLETGSPSKVHQSMYTSRYVAVQF